MPERPRRPTRRTLRKSFRVTSDELAKLQHNAAAAGLTLSAYVRRLAFGRKVRARRRYLDSSAVVQVSRVGNNLRQLQRVARASGAAEAGDDLDETYEELQAFMGDLLATFRGEE